MTRLIAQPLLLAALLATAACSGNDEAPAADGRDGFAGLADKAVTEIREEFATEDMDLGRGRNDEPMAKLSPQGDLIIGGEKVAMDDGQREIALAYRNALAQVAETGARIGLQGAALAGDALKLAAASALSGDGTTVEEQLKGQTAELEAEAKALCGLLPDLYARQQRFAEAVPAFAPYANMDEADIEKCGDGNYTP